MKGKNYIVVDCNNQATAVKRGDRVTVTAHRGRGDSHRLYAQQITDNGPSPKPTHSAKPTH